RNRILFHSIFKSSFRKNDIYFRMRVIYLEGFKMQKNILSLKLKAYRKQKGLTQEALAEHLNVSNKSISKWELNESYPSKKNMIKISEVLDISLETLMIEEQSENKRLKKSFKYSL